MRCSIGGINSLKCWGRAIQTMASVGDHDIHFTFLPQSLTLATFDSSVSICATTVFEREFFVRYEVPNSGEGKWTCRVPLKCILRPFRSMRFLSKSVSTCEIEMSDPKTDKLEIVIKCVSGASIRYFIVLNSNTEFLEVDYDTAQLKNCIYADAKLILSTLGNFSHSSKGVSRLTIKVTANKLLLKNSTTDLTKKNSNVHTEVTLNSVEFTEFTIELETEISFQMREFKCFANFAEAVKLPVSINFYGPAEPVIVQIKGDDHYEARLTLSTTMMGNDLTSESQSSSMSVPSIATGSMPSISSVASEPKSPPRRPPRPQSRRHNHQTPVAIATATTSVPPVPPSQEFDDEDFGPDFFNEDFPMPNSNRSTAQDAPAPIFQFPTSTFAVPSTSPNLSPSLIRVHSNKNENVVQAQLSGPPTKKLKAIFPNLGSGFEPSVDIPGHDIILVGNSDEETDFEDM